MIPVSTYFVLGALALGIGTGWKAASNHYDAKLLKQERAVHAQYVEDENTMNAVAGKFEEKKNEREIAYRALEKRVGKVVTDHVYRGQCVDARGLRIIADAVKGTNSSKPDAAMPTASDP